MNVFTFWEGNMPDYIDLCMKTWQFPYTILTYETVNNYTDVPITLLKNRFTLPQIADYIRVHVLRDNGGYWLDTDTIMLSDKLPDVTILGNNDTRMNTIGMLHTEVNSEMFVSWADYQESAVRKGATSDNWAILGNLFTDKYLAVNKDIKIGSIDKRWAETYAVTDNIPRHEKYKKFYFNWEWTLSDLDKTDMLMLHNSWTPNWYKQLNYKQILEESNCTLSNILCEVVK